MIINGREISDKVRSGLKSRIKDLKGKGVTPGLAVILVGDDDASKVYVRMKQKAFDKLNMHSKTFNLPADSTQEDILDLIQELNNNDNYHGILLQLPVPEHLDEMALLEAIAPEKDADGIHPISLGRMMLGIEGPLPCTPHGILKMLEYSDVDPEGKHAVLIGRSNIVGKPLSNLLSLKKDMGNATVTLCHSRTKNLKEITRQADILVVSTGQPEMVTSEYVKEGAVVIDVGVNRVEADNEKGYKLTGDVKFDEVVEKAGAISPVPGGVGPMTISMLLFNTVYLAERYS